MLRGVQKRLLKTDELPFCENTAVSRLCWRDGEITFDFLNDASHLSPEISTMQRQQRLKQGATDRADYSLWFEKAPEKAETWLAKLRSRTVGQLVLGAGDTQNSGVILDLSLDEAYRGRCFGQQLLGQAVSVLRNCGAREIQVSVPDANARAAHFFAENGFVPQTPGGAVLFKDIEVRPLP